MRTKTIRLLPCSRRNRLGLTAWLDAKAREGLRFCSILGPVAMFEFAPKSEARHLLLVDEGEATADMTRVGKGSIAQSYVYTLKDGAIMPELPLLHTGAFFIFFYVMCMLSLYVLLNEAKGSLYEKAWQWLPEALWMLMGYCLWSLVETSAYMVKSLHRPRFGFLWGSLNLLHALMLPAAAALLVAGMIL